MPNRVVVAIVATVGLLSSTIALAAAPEGTARQGFSTMLEVPAVVAASLTTPATIEPDAETAPNEAASADSVDSLAELVQQANVEEISDADAKCLATTIYYEARSESLTGQLAVANVVLERARSGRFPTSLCGVVTQPGQFSFVRQGQLPTPTHAGQWRTARAIAQIALDGSWDNPVEGALFFHSARVSPNWKHDRLTRIGGHIFYR
ncbi:spore germination cell wall hydrolase CwlJ-like protein [Sphingobium sp. B2D3A]|uniref:cell wall hydrolase n=1 Tax=unclassified Sphingobium TaxID=2611147 RepID=UPI0022248A08|nr:MULTISPECIES: cell wall hydrolase [unclassified Sphingobium]MCW2336361.1 spore germination cell wall hydrolase CwlJ-like protein [Sphingobium sp. B2D3A]MCW2386115.1 spore germination cell wall hydrolase CwlJ-like protein [Sphingobium sp. B2D3D]